jgi:inorganic triphosphatase YgiF
MSTPKEIEIKLLVSPNDLARLKTVPLVQALKTPATSATEASVYFDTGKLKLRNHGVVLRVRRVGDRYVQTIKAASDSSAFERKEWEAQIASDRPDLSRARGTALEPLLNGKLERQLKPIFETQVRRTVYPINRDGLEVALTVDRGKIEARNRSALLCEIELELERGTETGLFEFAQELLQKVPAQLSLKSKAERGYDLVDGQQDGPVKARPIALAPGMSAPDAVKRIGRACLRQIIDNAPPLMKGDPEGVHQMRVGLRRLRAAISLFADLLHDRQTAAIKRDLRWLTGELAPARDLDVLMENVVRLANKQGAQLDDVSSLLRDLVDHRDDAIDRAQQAVTSACFRKLTLDIAAWIEIGHCTKPRDNGDGDRDGLLIKVLATEQLDRRWRRIRKTGRAFAQLSAERRHKLRIRTKKLRYAVEFFADVFPGERDSKRRRKFATALERLQDGLGELNDIATHKHLVATTGIKRRRASAKRAFALLNGRESERIEIAIAATTKAFAKFTKLKPFW